MRALIELLLEMTDIIEGQEAELQSQDEQLAKLDERNRWQAAQLELMARRLSHQASTIQAYQEQRRAQAEIIDGRITDLKYSAAAILSDQAGNAADAAEPESCKR